MTSKLPLYLQLANDLENQIESHVLEIGEKLPSIRSFAQIRNVSVITVQNAYQLLEDKGLIHSLPKSGYYVSFHSAADRSQMKEIKPRDVHITSRFRFFTNEETDRSVFGNGHPAKDLSPVNKMNRILIRMLNENSISQMDSVSNTGYDRLRSHIVKYLFLKNLNAKKENILITNGCTEAVYLCLSTLCSAGDQIVMQSPCSYGILQMAETLNLKVIEVYPDQENGINIDQLRYILNNYNIKAVYLNPSVNNPLGTSLPLSTREQIAKLANRKRVFVIEDDVMGDLYYGSEPYMPIKHFDTGGHVIYCSSFTKTLIPTYRVGWVYSDLIQDQLAAHKQACNVGNSLLQQAVLDEVLQSGSYSRFTRKARQVYAERTRALREDILSAFPEGTQVSDPDGGFFLWVTLPDSVSADAYYEQLSRESIPVLPGSIFSLNDRYNQCFRMNAANYDPTLKGTVQRMGSLAASLTENKEEL